MAETIPKLIDSHCHLDYDGLYEKVDDVVARARSAGVERMVTISTRVRKLDKIREIASRFESVFYTVGTHPHQANEEDGITAAELISLSQAPKVVGLGEAGLDYHYSYGSPEAQKRGFLAHIEAAQETGLPLVIHTREAEYDTAAILTKAMAHKPFKAVLHCYTGTQKLAAIGVELGLYVSFSGILTFKNSVDLRAVANSVPLDRLMVETDAPFLAPMPHRGKSNEPSFVVNTARTLAEVKGVTYDEICQITRANSYAFYHKMTAPHDNNGVQS
jgi:TatD DNase family protein